MTNNESANISQQTKATFYEIWVAITKHQKLFLSLWILISLSGVMAAVMMPANYSYTTLVGLGTNYDGQQIETTAITRAKLNAVIILVAKRKYLDDGGVYDVDVEVLVKSPSVLSLESRGPIESAQDNYSIHKNIIEALQKDHKTIMTKASEKAFSTRKKISDKLKELEDESILLNKNLKRLDEMGATLQMQAIKSDVNAALLTIILNNQMELNRAVLRRVYADNTIAVSERRSELDNIEKSLDSMRETFYAVPTTQSKSPVGPNRILIAIGVIFSGLVIAILSVLLVDSFVKVRSRER